MDTNIQDLELQNPDDPSTNSDIEMVEKAEKIVNELCDENLSPDELPLINILMEEVAKNRQQLNQGDLCNEHQIDPGYNLLTIV